MKNLKISDFPKSPRKSLNLFGLEWNNSFIDFPEMKSTEKLYEKLKNLEIKIPNLDYQKTFLLIHYLITI